MGAMAKTRFNDGNGPSQRQLKVGELLRRTMSDLLMRGDVHDPDLERHSITVAEVQVSGDLRVAIAYVMPLGGLNQEEALEALNNNKGEIRYLIGRKIKMRHTPELRFILDDTFDRMEHSRAMFSQENVRRDLDD